MANTQLRFGVMCSGNHLDEWEARAIRQILSLPNAPSLSLLIVDAQGSVARMASTLWGKIRSVGFRNVAFYLLRRYFFDFKSCRSVDFSAEFLNIPKMYCQVKTRGKFSQYFKSEDIQKIKEAKLDFILRFGFKIVRGEILNSARFGVWSFHHDDEMQFRGGPPAFWEIFFGKKVTGAVLQRLTDSLDAGIVLKKGYVKTDEISYSKNLDQIYFETSNWPAEICRQVSAGVLDVTKLAPSATRAGIFRSPNNTQTLLFVLRLLFNRLKKRLSHWFIRDRWSVGIVRAPIYQFLNANFVPDIEVISHPKSTAYIADPFGTVLGGEPMILCEEYDHLTEKGAIARIHVGPGQKAKLEKLRLSLDCHLSYPYLFDYQNESFFIAESWNAKKVQLFRWHHNEWEDYAVLVDGVGAIDSTIFFHNGYWWLFFTDQAFNSNVNLFIYYSKSLKGPFQPHQRNPVKSDIRSARPAGTPFEYQGKLYRPAQNCSKTYGGSIVIHEVTALSPETFEEKKVTEITPPYRGPLRSGVHTLSSFGDITLIDGKVDTFIPHFFFHFLKKRLQDRGIIRPRPSPAAVYTSGLPQA